MAEPPQNYAQWMLHTAFQAISSNVFLLYLKLAWAKSTVIT